MDGLPLSSGEAPGGWGGVGEVDRGRKEGALGTTSLFPLPSVARALSFTLSPASKLPTRPSAKEASAEESGSFTQMLSTAEEEFNLKKQLTEERRGLEVSVYKRLHP